MRLDQISIALLFSLLRFFVYNFVASALDVVQFIGTTTSRGHSLMLVAKLFLRRLAKF